MDGEYRRWGQGYIQQPRLVLFVFGALEVPHMVLDFEQLQGMVRCIWASKFDGSDNVRPVLAF